MPFGYTLPQSAPPASPEPAYTVPAVPDRVSSGTVYPSSGGAPAHVPWSQPAAPANYTEWARNQRASGTVYGGPNAPADRPPPASAMTNRLENSGSLTGHILSQGADDLPRSKGRTVRVIVFIAIILLVLVGGGFLIATLAQGYINDVFSNLD